MMMKTAATVKPRQSALTRLGIAGLIVPTALCLVVLGALAVIFLVTKPPMTVAPWVAYTLIGVAVFAVIWSVVVVVRAMRAAPNVPADPDPATLPRSRAGSRHGLTAGEKGFRVASVGVLLLSLVTTALAVLAPFSSPCPSGGFSDAFHGSYDACWTFVHPAGGSLTQQSDGIRIVGAPHGDLYTANTTAPRLLQPVSLDHFAMETTLTIDEPTYHGDYQGAGLLVWQDAKNFIRFERGDFGSKDSGGVGFGIMTEGRYVRIVDTGGVKTQAKEVSLRLERDGDIYTAWWRVPSGRVWMPIGSGKVHLTHLSVGLIVAVGPSVEQAPIAAVFHSFTLMTMSTSHTP